MVKTYEGYLKLLESAIVNNGQRELSVYQIDKFIKDNNLDKDWHIVSSEVKKDMMPIIRRYTTVTPKPIVRPVRNTNGEGKKIKGYNEYLKFLENLIIQNGKKDLSQSQIDEFIRINCLSTDWGITSVEVRKDMKMILSKYQKPVINQPKPSKPVVKPSNNVVIKKVRSYGEYLQLLEVAMINNGNHELDASGITQFITSNKLDAEWGISAIEIRIDMKTISSKFARKARSEALKSKYRSGDLSSTENLNKSKPSIPQPIDKSQNVHRKSGLTDDDKKLVCQLRDMLQTYPDIMTDNRRLRSAIADILPGKKREVNLLGTLIDENIIVTIQNSNSLDIVLCDRFASILEEEFGTSMDVARRMVLMWFHAYGRMILGKNIE